jgi:dipeptidase
MISTSKESKKKAVDRRAFLKYAAGTAAALAATAGTSLVSPSIAQKLDMGNILPFPQNTITKPNHRLGPESCTSIIVGPGATADGSVLAAHNEDDEPFDVMNYNTIPHNDSPPANITTSYGLNIPMSYFTSLDIPGLNTSELNGYTWFGLLGSVSWAGGVQLGGESCGINEKQVVITGNEVWSEEPQLSPCNTPIDPVAGATVGKISIGDFQGIVLALANTAHQAMQLLGKLTENYGGVQEMALIADPTDGWIVERTCLHWAAVQVPHNLYLKRANSYRINTTTDPLNPFNPSLASPDAESYALVNSLNGYDGSTPFSWMDAYTSLTERGTANLRDTDREARIDYFLEPKVGKIQPQDLMEIMRDHFEGTELYHGSTSNPLNYPYGTPGSPHWENASRTICCAQESSNPTALSFVAHLRSWLPNPIGGLMWLCQESPCTGLYLPYYAGAIPIPTAAQAIGTVGGSPRSYLPAELPAPLPTPDTNLGDIYPRNVGPGLHYVPADATHPLPDGYYTITSAWWVSHRLRNAIDDKYPALHPHVRSVIDEFENKERGNANATEQRALALYNHGGEGETAAALSTLTSFMDITLQQGFDLLKSLASWVEAETHSQWP